MANMLKGIPIVYYNKEKTGADAFNRDIFTESAEIIQNVLVAPASTGDLNSSTNVSETILQYYICIPKGDTHNWRNVEVEFFGKRWRTIGDAEEWIESMVPLSWNKRVKVAVNE